MKEATTRDVFSTFATHLKPYRGWVATATVCVIFSVTMESLNPWVMKHFFDALSQPATPGAMQVILPILLTLLALKTASWVGWRISGIANIIFQTHVMADLQHTAMSYVLGHSYGFFTNSFSGGLVRKVGRLSRSFETIADEIQFRFLPTITILIATFIGLYLRFPTLAFIFLAWTALFIGVNYYASLWKLKIDIARAKADSENTAVLADAIGNAISIKLFSGIQFEKERYATVLESWRKLQARGWGRQEIIFAVQGALIIGVEFVLLYKGVYWWQEGVLTLGDLALIQTYLLAVFNQLWDIGRAFRHMFEGVADAKEMVEIMVTPHEIQDKRSPKALSVKRGKIEFKRVRFAFSSKRTVLDNFNLTIKPQEKIALVGPSGAGKSTITKLLFRFFDINKGDILVDGQSIEDVSQESLRAHIGLVPQEPVLFHRSLMENIRYGRRDATDAEVLEAARQAHCHEFISGLAHGYDTLVGERGVKLSGGERQRVAIARAILKNAPILVLDEATSSLDSESESLIQDALRSLMHDKTVIVIAHRLSTIMMMDRIVVVENGHITASGTHKELLKKGGTYERLWNIQAGGFTE